MSGVKTVQRGGTELGYAEITSNFTTASTTPVDVTGLSVTVTTGSRPIMVRAYAPHVINDTANKTCTLALAEDGTEIGTSAVTSATANAAVHWQNQRRRNPSAGSHTYKVTMKVSANNGTLVAGTGAGASVVGPAFIQVIEL